MNGDPQRQRARLLSACWAAYRAGDAEAAVRAARAAVDLDDRHGPSWWALGCASERCGRLREADHAFARGARVADEPQPAPFRVSWQRFLRSIELARNALKPDLQAALTEVSLVLADYPDAHLVDHHGQAGDSELLGLFEGVPRAEGQPAGTPTPRLHLWRRAHEHAAGSAKEFDAEVRTTLHHELGHYLGFDEDDLERFGLG